MGMGMGMDTPMNLGSTPSSASGWVLLKHNSFDQTEAHSWDGKGGWHLHQSPKVQVELLCLDFW
jgi:hypothetical protein